MAAKQILNNMWEAIMQLLLFKIFDKTSQEKIA